MNKFHALSIIFCVFCLTTSAQSENRVQKEYPASEIKTLKINNSFGEIKVSPSNGQTIDVLVVISAKDANDKRESDFLDNVVIRARQYGNTVELTTDNTDNGKSWKKVGDFSIDYTVKMPEQTGLVINSSFGDVRLNGSSGLLDLTIQHGDCFIAHAESDQNTIDIQFGDLRIESINRLNLKSQHGDISIDKGNNLTMDVQFGDSEIDLLSGNCRIESQHGDVTIDALSGKLQSLIIDVQFSDVSIDDFGPGHYRVDLTGSFSDFSWDKDWLVRSKHKGNTQSSFTLDTGNGKGEPRKIEIKSSHGDIDLD